MVDSAAGRPGSLRPDDPSNPYPGLTNFDLISHGFGNASVSTAVSVLQNYLQELTRIYDGGKPHPQTYSIPNGMPVHMGGSTAKLPVITNGMYGGSPPQGPQLYPPHLALNLLKQEPKEI